LAFLSLFGPSKIDEVSYKYGREAEHFDSFQWTAWGGHRNQSPFARNEIGCVANEVLKSNSVYALDAVLNMNFHCALPPPSSGPEEPAWLRQFRLDSPDDTAWTEQHEEEIAQVKTFQFRLDSISLNLGSTDGDEASGNFDDPKDFLLLIEDLDWK
jgi:hypothetical protein